MGICVSFITSCTRLRAPWSRWWSCSFLNHQHPTQHWTSCLNSVDICERLKNPAEATCISFQFLRASTIVTECLLDKKWISLPVSKNWTADLGCSFNVYFYYPELVQSSWDLANCAAGQHPCKGGAILFAWSRWQRWEVRQAVPSWGQQLLLPGWGDRAELFCWDLSRSKPGHRSEQKMEGEWDILASSSLRRQLGIILPEIRAWVETNSILKCLYNLHKNWKIHSKLEPRKLTIVSNSIFRNFANSIG